MNNKKIILKWSLLLIAFICLFVPYFHNILYSVPTADDFSMIVNVEPFNGIINNFIFGVKTASTRYITWGGTWFCFFLQVFLNPLLQFGYKGLSYGIYMVFNVGVSFVAVGFALNLLYKHLCKVEDKFWRMVLILLSFSVILLSNIYFEVFNWFVGSSYLWWFVFQILTIALIVLYFKEYSRKIAIILAIVGGIGCGSTLCCIPIGLVFLVFYANDCLKYKKINLKRLWPFIVFVVCGLIGVLAPGNTARNANLGEGGLKYVDAVYYGIIDCKMIIKDLIKNPYVILVVALFFMLGIWYNSKKRQEIKNPIIYFLVAIVVVMGSAYPVALGYGYYGTPNRIVFMVGALTLVYYTVLLFWLGEYISYKCKMEWKSKDIIMLLCMVGIYGYSAIIMTGNAKNSTWWESISNYKLVEKEHDYYISVLSYIENSEYNIVEIHEPVYEYTELIKPLYFTDDETYWINVGIARYFNKEGVRWISEE